MDLEEDKTTLLQKGEIIFKAKWSNTYTNSDLPLDSRVDKTLENCLREQTEMGDPIS